MTIRQVLLLALTALGVCLTLLSPLQLIHKEINTAESLILPLPSFDDEDSHHHHNTSTLAPKNEHFLQFARNTSTQAPKNEHALQFAPGQIRGAAMMLISKPWHRRRGADRKCYFNMSLDNLTRNWYPTNKYPLILQHPDGWTQQEMDDIRERWPQLEIYFSEMGSSFNATPPAKMEDDENPLGPLGYKRMCVYKTYGFLKSPYMDQLDYMFHIDDDACVIEPIRYDVFQKMKQNNIAYTYKQIFLDPDFVVKGLPDFIKDYKQKNNIQPANPSLEPVMRGVNKGSFWAFSTNLEWFNLNEFRRADVSAFHAAIHKSEMIFHRRWGDAPLRFVLPYLFFNNTQVMRLCSEYIHSSWPTAVNSCTDYAQTPYIQDAVLNHLPHCAPPWCN